MQQIKVVRVRDVDGRTEDDHFIEYEVCNISNPESKVGGSNDYHLAEGERLLSHSFIMDTMRKLMGRTLTIIDASYVDKEQRKAVKDLVRQVYNDEMSFSAEMAFDQEVFQNAYVPEDIVLGTKTVSVEQALGVK